ncbi:hypothetical protein T265_06334 [Opisthorchis viverrini]|uniref:Uncharacterized protein n=1 Tax=Opisthorchis viverrini TaxID=6198 RepID=A0A074ZKV4_OPIVI|nr:hypothetical protein T265_06334 [Opisthorchis viverrini]KER26417.1 hypothetical protein T265_06334 [Opisthorchis viverrini]
MLRVSMRSKLLTRLLKICQQPTTGFAPLGAHQVGTVPEFLVNTMFYLNPNMKLRRPLWRDFVNMVEFYLVSYIKILNRGHNLVDGLFAELGSWIANVSSPIEVASSPLNRAQTMSPRLVMKRLQSNSQARRTDQQPNSAPELPTFHNIAKRSQSQFQKDLKHIRCFANRTTYGLPRSVKQSQTNHNNGSKILFDSHPIEFIPRTQDTALNIDSPSLRAHHLFDSHPIEFILGTQDTALNIDEESSTAHHWFCPS